MRSTRSRRRVSVQAAAVLLPVASSLLVWGPPAQAADRVPLAGARPDWATARADRGGIPAQTTVSSRVYLAGRDPQGLARYAQAVSDPKSPLYQKYLSPQQVRERFGTSSGQRAAVTSWLTSSGLRITAATPRYVAFQGSATATDRAFGTRLHGYATSGSTYFAPSSIPSVPAALKDAVLGVAGLDDAPRQAGRAEALPGPGSAFVDAGPFSTYYGSTVDKKLPKAFGIQPPAPVRGYTGKQLRAVYGGTASGLTGKGVKVAVLDAYASPTLASDAATYAARNGDQPYRPHQLTQSLPKSYNDIKACDASGWYGEESMDVEAVHAVAPDADIVYVGAASCNDDDLVDATARIVDHHLADIVSNSWGDAESDAPDGGPKVYDRLFMEGAVEGIGFYFSSGDDGDQLASSGTKQIDYPSDSPWVTTVGGTSLAVGKNDQYLFETGWGTAEARLSADGKQWKHLPGTFTGGSGGGTSRFYAQPSYQRGIVPDALARAHGGTRHRTVPDIAAVADPATGFLVGQTQRWSDGSVRYGESRAGGTSLAAPVIAAVQAMAQQARGGVPIGFANPSIYARYGSSAYHDVTDHPLGADKTLAVARVDYANNENARRGTTTSLEILGKDSSLSATRGYDDVTGVGSPGADYLKSFLPGQRG